MFVVGDGPAVGVKKKEGERKGERRRGMKEDENKKEVPLNFPHLPLLARLVCFIILIPVVIVNMNYRKIKMK